MYLKWNLIRDWGKMRFMGCDFINGRSCVKQIKESLLIVSRLPQIWHYERQTVLIRLKICCTCKYWMNKTIFIFLVLNVCLTIKFIFYHNRLFGLVYPKKDTWNLINVGKLASLCFETYFPKDRIWNIELERTGIIFLLRFWSKRVNL